MLVPFLISYIKAKLSIFRSRKALESWQNKRVIKHIRWVIKNSPFYRSLYEGLDVNQWKDFPLITKQDMMENFETLNTCGVNKDSAFKIALEAEDDSSKESVINGVTVGLSTGTSGNRGLFLVSPQERFMWAGTLLSKTLPTTILKKQKIAFFFRTTSTLYSTLKSRLIDFQYYDLKAPFEDHLTQLIVQNPTILVAPPSMLRKLAKKRRSVLLPINFQKIYSIAEVLDPIDERYIKSSFNLPIDQIYQATEGFLATTCSHGSLHLNEDVLVIQKEYIPGAPSKFYPIITDFNRYSQPIIRYRLNDILHEKESPCSCGSLFTAIKFIEGRSDDIFYFKYKGSYKAIYPDYIRRAVIEADSSLEEYHVAQTGLSQLEISLKTDPENMEHCYQAVCERLIDLFRRNNIAVPVFELHPYQDCLNGKKLRRIERKFRIYD